MRLNRFFRDVKEQIVDKMPAVTDSTFIEAWDHLDFIWGLDAAKVVYEPIVKKMKKLVSEE